MKCAREGGEGRKKKTIFLASLSSLPFLSPFSFFLLNAPAMADPSLSAPVAKALLRLQTALDAGAAYEGQQVAKAAAARMRSRGSKEEAADLLGRAAEAQLRAGQVRRRERGLLRSLRGRRKNAKRERGRARAKESNRRQQSFRDRSDLKNLGLNLLFPLQRISNRSPAAASSRSTSSRTTRRTA